MEAAQPLVVGERVEALRQNGLWYSGKVEAVLGGSSLMVAWDDGDTEERMQPKKHIRRVKARDTALLQQIDQLKAQCLLAEQKAATQNVDSHWELAEWLSSIECTAVLADALKAPVDSKRNLGLPLLRALATCGSKDLVLQLLSEGRVLEKLADTIWEKSQALTADAPATGSELHGKFLQETGNFELSFGQLSIFFGGLEQLIGTPNPNVLEAMQAEHCSREDSLVEWTTGNYSVTTTPQIEWTFVMRPEKGPEQAGLREWPIEKKLVDSGDRSCCRKPTSLEQFDTLVDSLNRQLEDIGEALLTRPEVVGVRLYTGPMFEKYNGVNRGGALSINQPPLMKQRFVDLCKGNRYTTTVHVINSALIKLSKLQKAGVVYRGIVGGLLPNEFWQKNAVGVCGGIEFGFLSTTEDLDVAKAYAQGGHGRAATVFEIQMGMVDRGADISEFSQYPHEREVCFAPLTGIEILGTRVEGTVLMVQARLNVNLVAMTIEQVVSKRRKIVADMCSNLENELMLQVYQGDHMDEVLREEDLLAGETSFRKFLSKQFEPIVSQAPEVFNDDAKFRQSIDLALEVKKCIFLDCAALEKIGNRGPEAAACGALVARHIVSNESDVHRKALDTLLKLQVRTSYAEAIERVVADIEEGHATQRPQTVETLGRIAAKGNRLSIDTMATRLSDMNYRVRAKALGALEQIAEKGNRTAIEALLAQLNTKDKLEPVKLLGDMAESGDEQVIEALTAILQDENAQVRVAAAVALAKVEEKDYHQMIEMLIAYLMDEDPSVCVAAAGILPQHATGDDPQVLQALSTRIKGRHESDEVRAAVWAALSTMQVPKFGSI